jgi:hypothetical protein
METGNEEIKIKSVFMMEQTFKLREEKFKFFQNIEQFIS